MPKTKRANGARKAKPAVSKKILAERFRRARHICGLTVPQAAKLLHVTPRTVHNWEAGTVRVPFAAYKLMRILRGVELPNGCELLSNAWAGWRFHGDKLISPEGREFVGTDSAWWSLLVQRARLFGTLSAKARAAKPQSAPAVAADAADAGAPAAPRSEPDSNTRAEGLQSAACRGMVGPAEWQFSAELPAAGKGPAGSFWYQADTRNGDFSPVEPVKSGGNGPSSNTGQKGASQAVGAAQ